jgi:hypothetical protein
MPNGKDVSGPAVIEQQLFRELGDTLASEIVRAARRSPAAAFGIAVVAGFLVGRAIRSR